MRFVDRFDVWVRSGPFTPLDLGVYRIVFAVGTLCVAPSIRWLDGYPDAMYAAPPGPFQLISGFPSSSFLVALEILRTLALVFLMLGLWTKFASVASSILLLVTYGLTYTLGKVDHTILLVMAPLILAFANWGDRLSIDSILRGPRRDHAPQWPLRYLALCVGLAFFVAAAMKLGTGWLNPSSQAVRGYFIEYYILQGRTEGLAGLAFGWDIKAFWECLDWATVILEFAILATVPWWRAFRIALAMIVFFHLGVFLLMNITFSQNLIPYGAFVAWGAIVSWASRFTRSRDASPTPAQPGSSPVKATSFWLAIGILLSAGAWLSVTHLAHLSDFIDIFTIAAASLISAAYLARETIKIAQAVRKRRISIGSDSS